MMFGAFRETLAMAARFEEWRIKLMALGLTKEQATEVVQREGLDGIRRWTDRFLSGEVTPEPPAQP